MLTRRLTAATAGAALILGGLIVPAVAEPPPNDDVAAATVVAVPDALMQDTSEATSDASDPELSCTPPAGATVWFAFTATTDDSVFFTTAGSDYDTTLSVYSGLPSLDTEIACNDDSAGSFTSTVFFQPTAGETYLIMAGSFGEGPGGSLLLESDFGEAPPAPSIEVTVDPRGTFDSRSGTARLSGTYTCSPDDVFGFVGVELRQRAGRVVIVGGGGQDLLQCDGSEQPWTLVVEPFNGLYKGGRAEASVFGEVCTDFECVFVEDTQTVRLSGTTKGKKG